MERGKSRLITMAESFRDRNNAVLKAAKKFILEQDLTEAEMKEYIELYPKWDSSGIEMKIGDLVKYNGKLYKCILAHTTSEEFNPEITNYAFVEVSPDEVIPDWKPSEGYEDAYDEGDKVVFEGNIYESLISGNTWSPSEASQHWKLIEED